MDDKTKNKLACLCGACGHDVYDKSCAYNKILASNDPATAQFEAIKKLIESVIKSNTKTKGNTNARRSNRSSSTKRTAKR